MKFLARKINNDPTILEPNSLSFTSWITTNDIFNLIVLLSNPILNQKWICQDKIFLELIILSSHCEMTSNILWLKNLHLNLWKFKYLLKMDFKNSLRGGRGGDKYYHWVSSQRLNKGRNCILTYFFVKKTNFQNVGSWLLLLQETSTRPLEVLIFV